MLLWVVLVEPLLVNFVESMTHVPVLFQLDIMFFAQVVQLVLVATYKNGL